MTGNIRGMTLFVRFFGINTYHYSDVVSNETEMLLNSSKRKFVWRKINNYCGRGFPFCAYGRCISWPK